MSDFPSQEQWSQWAGRTVSQETILKWRHYLQMLSKWNPAINLVAPSTLPDAHWRHLTDSVQLLRFLPTPLATLYDLGSGGGFPGLALAMALPHVQVHMIDSDRRKGEFLRAVSRETGLKNSHIHTGRVEEIAYAPGAVVTARGFAPIATILDLLEKDVSQLAGLLLLKGRGYRQELDDARQRWQFQLENYASLTDPNSAILWLSQVQSRG